MNIKNSSNIMTLYSVAFYSGFSTMAFEMLLGRALVPYFGGTIYTWGALIGVFLLGMSIGFLKGGSISLRSPDIKWIGFLLILAGISMGITPFFLSDLCIFLVENVEDIKIGAFIAVCIYAFLPAAFLAAISPFCVRLAVDYIENVGSIAGKLSAINTIGSIIGTISTSFFLIPNFGTKTIFLAIALLSIFLAIFILVNIENYLKILICSQKKYLFATLYIVYQIWNINPVNAQGLILKDGIIESVESEYNNIFVIKRDDLIYMNFGYKGSQYVESIYNFVKPKDLVVEYTRLMPLGFLYLDKYERGAFIGLGGGRTASYIINTIPEISIDVAEIDKEVIRFAKKYFNVEESSRLKIVAEDGRVFLMRSKEKYDIIFLDAYRGPFVPFHLLTKEFFQLIKTKMNPNGVVVQNVEPNTMLLDSAIKTIGSVFSKVDTFSNSGNIVVVGSSISEMPKDYLKHKAKEFNLKYKPLYDAEDLIKYKKEIEISNSAKILTDDFAPVEMLNTIKRHNQKMQ